MNAELDLSLEIVILLVLAIFMLLFGFLLIPINAGALPYNANATYGLFQVIVSFQIIALGKTPFGDFRRSWLVVVIGICSAILGMAASFIPGSLTSVVRVSVGLVLLGGGLRLLVQLLTDEEKARAWMRIGGLLSHLTIACILVYGLTIALGAITLFPGIATNTMTALLLIAYGAGFTYLAWCIWNVRRTNPPPPPPQEVENVSALKSFDILSEAALPLSVAILLLLGVLLTLLGLLLFPVNLGLIAFSPDGQFGLLLMVMAIQIVSLGDTPLGIFRQSSAITLVGLAFAALGVVSSIVPGLLTAAITVLLGALNVAGAGGFLLKRYFAGQYRSNDGGARVAAVANIETTQTMVNWVALAFGISMLVPQLIPGLVVAGVLVVNGLLLFRLASNLWKVTKMQQTG